MGKNVYVQKMWPSITKNDIFNDKRTRVFIVYVSMNQHRGFGLSVRRWGEAKHEQSWNTGEVPTCLGSQIHFSNKLFVPSAQCPEGPCCLMNEEKCRVVGNTCQAQCALICSCVFSMESIKKRSPDLFFAFLANNLFKSKPTTNWAQ